MSSKEKKKTSRNDVRKKLVAKISNRIRKGIRGLTKDEEGFINEYLRNVNFNRFAETGGNQMINILRNEIFDVMKTKELQQKDKSILDDEKQVSAKQLKTLNIQTMFGINSMAEIKRELFPKTTFYKSYVVLDSRYKRKDIGESGDKFSWYYVLNKQVLNETFTTSVPIENVVSIKLLQPIIPISSLLTTDSQRVSILIEELRTSAFIASNSRRYHFLCRYTNSLSGFSPARHIDLQTEGFNDGEYHFDSPVNLYNSITLSFGNPDTLLTFNPDTQSGTVTTYGATTEITTPSDHNLQTGDIVYVSGFDTGTPSYDNDNVNTEFGHTITVTAATTFTIPVDTSSGSVSWTPSQPVSLYYPAFSLIIPMEITTFARK